MGWVTYLRGGTLEQQAHGLSIKEAGRERDAGKQDMYI